MDILPIHKYMGIEEKKQFIRDAAWLDAQKKVGQEGENIVKAFLEEKYQANVIIEPDYMGYDFSVILENREFVVEVKTTNGHENRFFISCNELQCAEKMRELYYLYYITLKKDKGRLYVINNPIETFNIDRKVLYGNLVENDIIHAQIEGLIIMIDDVQLENYFVTDIMLV